MSEVICFNYLYRDSGNYKKFGNKSFTNPDLLTIEKTTQMLEQELIDQAYFYPEQVGSKKLKFRRSIDDYLCDAKFTEYYGSKPMSITWKLSEPMPPYLWKDTAKMAIG